MRRGSLVVSFEQPFDENFLCIRCSRPARTHDECAAECEHKPASNRTPEHRAARACSPMINQDSVSDKERMLGAQAPASPMQDAREDARGPSLANVAQCRTLIRGSTAVAAARARPSSQSPSASAPSSETVASTCSLHSQTVAKGLIIGTNLIFGRNFSMNRCMLRIDIANLSLFVPLSLVRGASFRARFDSNAPSLTDAPRAECQSQMLSLCLGSMCLQCCTDFYLSVERV